MDCQLSGRRGVDDPEGPAGGEPATGSGAGAATGSRAGPGPESPASGDLAGRAAPGLRTRAWLETVQGWLLPPRCVLCLDPGQSPTRDLCGDCEAELPWQGPACPRCAEASSWASSPSSPAQPSPPTSPAQPSPPCARCLAAPPPFDAALAPLRYAWPADAMIRRFKYSRQLPFGRVLALLLAERAAAEFARAGSVRPDCLVPVPLHPERERLRGCNQAWEIARVVGRRLGVPVAARGCSRVRDTPPQAGLDAAARGENLRGAFVVGRLPARVRRVALVDDVLTTGATLGELARVLKAAGIERVEAWTVARA